MDFKRFDSSRGVHFVRIECALNLRWVYLFLNFYGCNENQLSQQQAHCFPIESLAFGLRGVPWVVFPALTWLCFTLYLSVLQLLMVDTFSPSVPVAPPGTLVGTYVEPLRHSLMKVCVGIPLMKKAVSVQFESGAVRPTFHPLHIFNSCSKLETLL